MSSSVAPCLLTVYLFTAGLPKRPTLFQIITNQLNKHGSKQWLLSITYRPISICPRWFFSTRSFFLRAQHQHPSATSRRKTPQHVFPVAFFPPCLLATDLYQRFTESQSASGALSSPHVSPQVCVKKEMSPPAKKQANGRRGCGVSFPLSLSLSLAYNFLSSLRFPGVIL